MDRAGNRARGPSPQPLAAASLRLQGAAQAAGGHHAVDDDAILSPGQCQAELKWAGALMPTL